MLDGRLTILADVLQPMQTDFPEFETAVSQFRAFLRRQGHPDHVRWLFRDDILACARQMLHLALPEGTSSEALARKVYAEGVHAGLVEIAAICHLGQDVGATVWFPKHPGEAVQGWDVGLKLSVREPLPRGVPVAKWLRPVRRLLPAYRRVQQHELWVGTRKWAAS